MEIYLGYDEDIYIYMYIYIRGFYSHRATHFPIAGCCSRCSRSRAVNPKGGWSPGGTPMTIQWPSVKRRPRWPPSASCWDRWRRAWLRPRSGNGHVWNHQVQTKHGEIDECLMNEQLGTHFRDIGNPMIYGWMDELIDFARDCLLACLLACLLSCLFNE